MVIEKTEDYYFNDEGNLVGHFCSWWDGEYHNFSHPNDNDPDKQWFREEYKIYSPEAAISIARDNSTVAKLFDKNNKLYGQKYQIACLILDDNPTLAKKLHCPLACQINSKDPEKEKWFIYCGDEEDWWQYQMMDMASGLDDALREKLEKETEELHKEECEIKEINQFISHFKKVCHLAIRENTSPDEIKLVKTMYITVSETYKRFQISGTVKEWSSFNSPGVMAKQILEAYDCYNKEGMLYSPATLRSKISAGLTVRSPSYMVGNKLVWH